MFTLNPNYYASVFVVPSVIVEKYIKMASFCALKTLLWILKNQGGNFSVEEIAKAVGSSPADTKEAIDYWINEGVLIDTAMGNTASLSPIESDSHLKMSEPVKKPIVASEIEVKSVVEEIKPIRPTLEQVADRINEDKQLAGLMLQIEKNLGRTIGYDTQSSIVMMYDTYGLDVSVILTLIEYCKLKKDPPANADIIRTAKQWYDNDITTLEKANEFIDRNKELNKVYFQFCSQTGFTSPKPTPKQRDYLLSWIGMGFDVEMIVFAYNEMNDRTGKISFAYMNKVLLNWKEKGYKTPYDVEKAVLDARASANAVTGSKRSYDINKAIEKARNDDLIYQKKKRADK